jgi:hypothetical protein
MTSRQTDRPVQYTLGRAAWAAICAVDGLQLTDEMQREFAEYDRLQLSQEERLQAILAKYGKAR